MKKWNIEIFLLDEHGNEKPANCFTKATYNLHPSFLKPVQSIYSYTSILKYLLMIARSFQHGALPMRERRMG